MLNILADGFAVVVVVRGEKNQGTPQEAIVLCFNFGIFLHLSDVSSCLVWGNKGDTA